MHSSFVIKKSFLVFFLLFPFCLQAQTNKISLRECYELALKRSETIQISDEAIVQARARYAQALSQILPKVNIKVSEFLQDDSANTSNNTTTGQVVNTFTRFSRPEVALNISQNLFQGFREITAIRLAGVDESQQRFSKEDAQRLLYKDVATAFVTIVEIEQDIQSSQKILASHRNRIQELKKRISLGKSRESEELAQEAEAKLLEASLQQKKGDLKVAYEMLSFLTGLDPQPSIHWIDPNKLLLRPLGDYVLLAESRPDVMAKRKAAEIAKGNIKITRADLLPNAKAEANFYPYRVGFQKDIHWDATFTLNIPVFNWGSYGLIREVKSKAKQSELQVQLLQRQAVTDIKKAYDTYRSSMEEYRKYNGAAQKSEQSFQKQLEDYNLGLITNLDVLHAQSTWLEALRQRNDSRIRVLSHWVALQITAGIKP